MPGILSYFMEGLGDRKRREAAVIDEERLMQSRSDIQTSAYKDIRDSNQLSQDHANSSARFKRQNRLAAQLINEGADPNEAMLLASNKLTEIENNPDLATSAMAQNTREQAAAIQPFNLDLGTSKATTELMGDEVKKSDYLLGLQRNSGRIQNIPLETSAEKANYDALIASKERDKRIADAGSALDAPAEQARLNASIPTSALQAQRAKAELEQLPMENKLNSLDLETKLKIGQGMDVASQIAAANAKARAQQVMPFGPQQIPMDFSGRPAMTGPETRAFFEQLYNPDATSARPLAPQDDSIRGRVSRRKVLGRMGE